MTSVTKNAADEAQVRKDGERQKSAREQELVDLKFVLSHPAGRRFLWRLLGHFGVFKSIWEPSAKIHYNAGLQDGGHFLLAEVEAADQEALFVMQREAKKREEI